jgi:hypothetical protein
MLKEWQSENEGIIYSYFDTYAAMSSLIQSPASYGITMFSFHENYDFYLSELRTCLSSSIVMSDLLSFMLHFTLSIYQIKIDRTH